MTTSIGVRPQPLPGNVTPGPIPGTQEPDVWNGSTVATIHFRDLSTGHEVDTGGPGLIPGASWAPGSPMYTGPMWTAMGSSLNDAVAAAAKLSLRGAGPADLHPYAGTVPSSHTIALLQARDGAYFATQLHFFAGAHGASVIPAVGVKVHTTDGHPMSFDFEKQHDALKALVWADQWVDFSKSAVGEHAMLGSSTESQPVAVSAS